LIARSVFLSFILCFTCHISRCQTEGSPNERDVQDTTSIKKTNSFTSIFYGQPGKAALYSLILPGAGQVYNKRIWKVPIIYAGEGFAAYNLIQNLRSFRRNDRCWKSLVADINAPHADCGTTTTVSDAFSRRQSARANKETAWIIMSGAHLLNVVEAFVDRHLINFDTSEDISYHNMPSPDIVPSSFNLSPVNVITFRISLNDYRSLDFSQ